jgi:DnaK suppressor protein
MNIDHFKKKLEEEKKLVEKELGELGWKNPQTGEWDTDTTDVDASATERDELADRQEEYEERSEELAPLEARYKDINDAIQKIEEGTYGKCEKCGEPIEEDRLEVNPAARTCKKDM